MQIAFGGGDAFVAEHLFDFCHRGAVALEIGGEGMAQRVRVKIAKAGGVKRLAQAAANGVYRGRQMAGATLGAPNIVRDPVRANVGGELAGGFGAEVDFARFLAFADKLDAAAV